MIYTEILNANGLTRTQWSEQLWFEYIRASFWSLFMGKDETAIIHVKQELMKAKGSTITFPLIGELEGGVVTGNQEGAGNEGSFETFNDSVTVDNVRIVARLDDIKMSKQRAGLDLLELSKSRIVRKAKTRLDDEITDALVDTSVGRVRGKYLYGVADSNWNATHATALQAIDNVSDQLRLKLISTAKRKATIRNQGSAAKIMPMMVKNDAKRLEEWYAYVAHTFPARDLVENDATFANRQLNLPPSPTERSQLFTGSNFLGAHDGVLMYEWEGIRLESSTIQTAANMLLGAQAVVYGIAQKSEFNSEDFDLGHRARTEIHDIRGITKAAFNRSTVEDHGVVHSYTAAVAD